MTHPTFVKFLSIKPFKASGSLHSLFLMLSNVLPHRKHRERIDEQEKSLEETFHRYDTHRAVSLINTETRYDKYLFEARVMECILSESVYEQTFIFLTPQKSFVL